MSTLTKTVGWLGTGLLVGGAALYGVEQYKLSQQISFGFGEFKVLRFGLNNSRVGITMTVKNDGTLEAEVSKVSVNIYANNIHIGYISQIHGANINPNGSVKVPLQVNFNPKQVLGSLGQIAMTSKSFNSIEFKFKGWVTAKKAGFPIPVRINEKMTVQEMLV